MGHQISSDIVEKWLKAWSLSRNLPLPVKFESGFSVNVGYGKQKVRYVFPELNEDFVKLSKSINEPWVFLKVCAAPDDVKQSVSEKWAIQPQGFMMSCFQSMNIRNINLPDDYILEFDKYNSTFVLSIVTKDGEPASIGRLVVVGDLAVYDRVLTESRHRRKGLARYLMKELERIALSMGISRNILVATEEGKSLYQSLGWTLCSPYTSIVILP